MEDQASPTKTYPVPAEVMAAIATGRPALLQPLRARIKNGQIPTPEEWMGIVDMMADVMVDRQHEREAWREERETLIETLKDVCVDGPRRVAKNAEAVLERLEKWKPGE